MRVLFVAVGSIAILFAAPARAQESKLGYTGFVGFGPQLSIAFCCDEHNTYGIGVEASYSRFRPKQWTSYGGFAQWQVFLPGSRGYHRFAAGAQAGWTAFGSELGLAAQTSSPVTHGGVGLQWTPYLSGGFVWTGFRFTFPGVSSVDGKSHGMRVEWVLTGKLPIRVDGDETSSKSGSSRWDFDD
jgi:hypothetical protein